MKRISCKQIAVVTLAVMATALVAPRAHPDPKTTVINTVTNPVPVVVENFPSGTNTVLVSSSTNAPLLVRDVDKSARTFFEENASVQLPSGLTGKAVPIITVPAGKRAVIETITVQVLVPPGQTPSANLNLHALCVTRQGPFAGGDLWTGTHPIRIYSEPEQVRVVGMARSPATGEANASFTITGYLEDAK